MNPQPATLPDPPGTNRGFKRTLEIRSFGVIWFGSSLDWPGAKGERTTKPGPHLLAEIGGYPAFAANRFATRYPCG
jgi:hypothetical protein